MSLKTTPGSGKSGMSRPDEIVHEDDSTAISAPSGLYAARHPLRPLLPLLLGLLPCGQHRGGEEDRRVGPRGYSDEQRKSKVAESRRPQDESSDEENAAYGNQGCQGGGKGPGPSSSPG